MAINKNASFVGTIEWRDSGQLLDRDELEYRRDYRLAARPGPPSGEPDHRSEPPSLRRRTRRGDQRGLQRNDEIVNLLNKFLD